MGSVTITHPFHPLNGQTFEVLCNKKFNGKDILSLKAENGSLCVLREWTDKTDLDIYQDYNNPSILSVTYLEELIELISMLSK